MTDTTDIAALRPAERAKLGFVTDDNTGGHYVAECEECGQIFPSQTCDGDGAIADTGDYGDCYCPHCGFIDPPECDNANLVWNVQQLKIVNLTKQFEAERHRADKYRDCIRVLADKLSVNALPNEIIDAVAELAALKGEQVPVDTGIFTRDELAVVCKARVRDMPENYADHQIAKVALRSLFTAPQKPVVLPEINEDLVEILGRPNFTCSRLAELLRRNGADIKRKSENEQAYVIHWLLGIYLKHGIEWRATAESELKSLAAKASADAVKSGD